MLEGDRALRAIEADAHVRPKLSRTRVEHLALDELAPDWSPPIPGSIVAVAHVALVVHVAAGASIARGASTGGCGPSAVVNASIGPWFGLPAWAHPAAKHAVAIANRQLTGREANTCYIAGRSRNAKRSPMSASESVSSEKNGMVPPMPKNRPWRIFSMTTRPGATFGKVTW